MMRFDDIESSLRQKLPTELHSVIPALAQLLVELGSGTTTPEDAQSRLATDQRLSLVLQGLAKQQAEIAGKLISFEGAQVGGNISIGDVAGGDIIKLSIGTLIGAQHNYYTYSTIARSPQEQRNRRAMLTKVRKIWVEGLLERSLTDELRIDLNLVDRPDAVHLPLNAVVQELDRPPRTLLQGMPISEVFDQVGGELLILGAPGAGKTTLLLELLRDLLHRAEREETHPLPIVFPLSTWAAERKLLKDWLVDQLNVIYNVPKRIGQEWMAENEILPLLDGLDEVAAEHRDACVEAINRYRQEIGGLVPTAVASRVADYGALKGKLRFQGAVLIEPLTHHQLEDYLARIGEPLRAIRELVYADHEVMELLDSPLMLSVVSLVFRDASPETLRVEGTFEKKRMRLWEAYIERMFLRKQRDTQYDRDQIISCLAWLAWSMNRFEYTGFFIELLEPRWLSRKSQKTFNGAFALIVFVLYSFMFLFSISTIRYLQAPLLSQYMAVLFIITGILLGLWPLIRRERIVLAERIYTSWRLVFIYTAGGGVAGWLFDLAFRLLIADIGSFFVYFGTIIGLLSSYNAGTKAIDARISTRPAQGVYNSVRMSIIFGLIVLAFTSFMTPTSDLTAYIIIWSFLSPGLVLGTMMRLGGLAIMQHFIIRWLLFLDNRLPISLVSFLDYCSDRLFLRRVGGGYIFVHRMLLEHFAAKYEELQK